MCVLSNEFFEFSCTLKTLYEYISVPILSQLVYNERHISMCEINAVSDE